MAKVKTVKWSIGADEPDDLQEFLSNDEILDKHTNRKTQEVSWPSRGPLRFKVINVKVRPIKSGDNAGKDRLSVMLVLDEPKKSEASSWNGYAIFDGFNVTDQGAQFLKRWLRAIGVEWSDFVGKSKQDDQDPPHLVQIGKVKFEGASDVHLRATVKIAKPDDYYQEEHLEIGRYLPANEEPEPEPEDEPEDDEDDVESFDEAEEEDDESEEPAEDEDDDEDDEEEDEDEPDDEDEEEDDEAEELREELSGMTKQALTKRAQRTAKKFKGDPNTIPSRKADLVEWIVNAELGEPPF